MQNSGAILPSAARIFKAGYPLSMYPPLHAQRLADVQEGPPLPTRRHRHGRADIDGPATAPGRKRTVQGERAHA